MILRNALLHITGNLGDPEGNQLFDRAEDHFILAISTLLLEGEYQPQEIPGYYKLTDIAFDDSDTEDISDLDVFVIRSMFPNPNATSSDDIYGYTVTFKQVDEVRFIASNDEFSPSGDDFFVYRVGNTLYPVSDLSYPLQNNDRIKMEYIEYPDNADWDTGVGGTELVGLFTVPFIYRAIHRAVQTLGEEDARL